MNSKPYSYGSVPAIHSAEGREGEGGEEEAAKNGHGKHGSDSEHEHRREGSDSLFTAHLLQNIKDVSRQSFIMSNDDVVVLHHFSGTSTIPSHITNMTKNLIGGGVLSLSGGMAIFANSPKACFSALLWVALLGCVFGYFSLL